MRARLAPIAGDDDSGADSSPQAQSSSRTLALSFGLVLLLCVGISVVADTDQFEVNSFAASAIANLTNSAGRIHALAVDMIANVTLPSAPDKSSQSALPAIRQKAAPVKPKGMAQETKESGTQQQKEDATPMIQKTKESRAKEQKMEQTPVKPSAKEGETKKETSQSKDTGSNLAAVKALQPSNAYSNPNTKSWDTSMSTADPNIGDLASSTDGKLHLVKLDPWKYPTARCNDGSQGIFYYSPPPPGHKHGKPDNYIVMLEGGGWCSDIQGCRNRMRNKGMTSSRGASATRGGGGCLSNSDSRNPYIDAHKVFLRYCSSDGHSGNRDASDPLTGGLHFRGAVIVASVLQELTRSFGLASGDSLFLGGFSAGARGAMFNLDYAHKYIPHNVRVVGLLDSPFWLDIYPFPLARSCRGVLSMANASGVLGNKCKAAFPSKEDQWKCLLGQYRMHYLENPYVIAAAQYDGFQMGVNNGEMNGKKMWKETDPEKLQAEKKEFREIFGRQTKAELKTLQPAAGSIFSTTCGNHVTSSGNGLWDIQIVNETTGAATTLNDLFKMARDHKFGEVVIADCTPDKPCKGCYTGA